MNKSNSIDFIPNEDFFATAEHYRGFKKGVIWKDMRIGYEQMLQGVKEALTVCSPEELSFHQGCVFILNKLLDFPDLCIDEIEQRTEEMLAEKEGK